MLLFAALCARARAASLALSFSHALFPPPPKNAPTRLGKKTTQKNKKQTDNLKVTVVELPDDFFGAFDATKSQMAFDLPGKKSDAKLVVTRCKGTASGCAEVRIFFFIYFFRVCFIRRRLCFPSSVCPPKGAERR